MAIRPDTLTSDAVLSEVPPLADVFAALDAAPRPKDSLNEADRERKSPEDRPALDQLFADEAP